MKRACPTIQELLAFDAVAKHESFTRAANVLCVTVSGVSKQIASLESFVGRPLLQKAGRGVTLTAVGREYWGKISPSLRVIESATFEARLDESSAGILTLASVPTFLTKWLIPRLPSFRKLHPGVTFSFSQHLRLNDSQPADIDAAIRFGAGNWPSVVSIYIAGKEFICIYAAKLEQQLGHSLKPSDLLKQTLLHHEETPFAWRKWAAHWNIDETSTLAGPRFTQYSAIIQAVVNGLGAGLVPRILVEEELAQGVVLQLGPALEFNLGHYLCFNPNRMNRPIFAAFHSWILTLSKAEQPCYHVPVA
ncbi:Transcriptional regulators, LysR family (plasmid) [Mycetohabitans rhizoxinica HKI 454]|uniref:Transcriptional regulators, LysR family n=1 Tax=Mycetohabitans rhizoxinica (strain DSM 19002 / CIP 109453 / HKI 454) TaxID=882378 RepID=E5AVQ4_MYCRK|nr:MULTISPECIES: LysR substrate-binding domain-containing protein [Mycetohabitans]MCG1048231.1 LysR family transcriptional regulator [Mycetohabitans sp. B6]CBW77178.1 Transcriptional regulators, LysR family [Mycetohabitans rhizoxinica HKI 454]